MDPFILKFLNPEIFATILCLMHFLANDETISDYSSAIESSIINELIEIEMKAIFLAHFESYRDFQKFIYSKKVNCRKSLHYCHIEIKGVNLNLCVDSSPLFTTEITYYNDYTNTRHILMVIDIKEANNIMSLKEI